jgi:hypothetical protein
VRFPLPTCDIQHAVTVIEGSLSIWLFLRNVRFGLRGQSVKCCRRTWSVGEVLPTSTQITNTHKNAMSSTGSYRVTPSCLSILEQAIHQTESFPCDTKNRSLSFNTDWENHPTLKRTYSQPSCISSSSSSTEIEQISTSMNRISLQKRVRFHDIEPCIVHSYISRCDLSCHEITDTWWSTQQLDNICQSAYQVAAYATRGNSSVLMQRIWMKSIQLTKNCDDNTESLDVVLQSPRLYQTDAIQWCQKAHGRRGLECHILQKRNTQSRCSLSTDQYRKAVIRRWKSLPSNDKETILANFSSSLSRSDLIMARMIGHADTVAAACS